MRNGYGYKLRDWEAGRSNSRAPETMVCPTESFFFREAGCIW
nr:MAG TPA: hypothetical protein [Caudoviricetes sp.]